MPNSEERTLSPLELLTHACNFCGHQYMAPAGEPCPQCGPPILPWYVREARAEALAKCGDAMTESTTWTIEQLNALGCAIPQGAIIEGVFAVNQSTGEKTPLRPDDFSVPRLTDVRIECIYKLDAGGT